METNNKLIVTEILKKAPEITRELLKSLEEAYGITFEIFDLPNYGIHSIDRYPERIRLFKSMGKIFL